MSLLGVWLLTRVLSVLSLRAFPWVPYDVVIYSQWADGLRSGSFPVSDPRWQYPDLIALILLIPSYLPGTYITAFVLLALVADLAIMSALLLAWGRTGGWVGGVWVWALAGVWIGPVLLVRLDLFATLFAVLALVATRRWWLAPILAALGAGLKVWPAVTLIATRRTRILASIGIFIVSLLGAVGLVRALLPSGDSFFGAQASRGLQAEATGVLPFLVRGLWGARPEFVESHGTLELVSPWAGAIGITLTILGILIVLALTALCWTNRLPGVNRTDVVFAALLILVVTSRVFSPQFYIWIAGVGAVAVLARDSVMRWPLALVVCSSIVAMYVYPFRNGWETGETGALLMQLLRLLLILAATVMALIGVLRATRLPHAASRGLASPKVA